MANQVTEFNARAEVQIGSLNVTPVQGADGIYSIVRVQGSGPVQSNDPRMEGTFLVDATIVDNPNSGRGVSIDDFKIIDTATGKRKAKGRAIGMDAQPNPIKALSSGKLADGSLFFALAKVTLPPPGSTNPIIIEYGGVPDADRAVIVSGDLVGFLSDDD